MKTAQIPNLPIAADESTNEQTLRRSVEQYLQDLRGDVVALENQTSRVATLALRRHQFLLMGA